MPDREGLALYRAGLRSARFGPLLEIGGYCGKSAIYLGAAALETGSVLFSIDHHRGSEEHQPGESHHDPALIDPAGGRFDSLPAFRRTIAKAGLEDVVVAVVGRSKLVASVWRAPLGLVLIDGGHSEETARADYEGWAPLLSAGGLLLIHDVFADAADGGQAPFHVYQAALASGRFREVEAVGSLRVLEKT